MMLEVSSVDLRYVGTRLMQVIVFSSYTVLDCRVDILKDPPICVCVYEHSVCMQLPIGAKGARVTGAHQPPAMGTRNQAQVL